MAHYLVRAKALPHKLPELRSRLDSGEIRAMQPFGKALDHSLRNARVEGEWLVWEEEDYCRPPLAMERAAVLDAYFTDLGVERVEGGEGWKRLEGLPRLWEVP
ncbi:hypothetical protein Mterra_02430 [Calidithermus terrae]|uniref:Uncharacterized protein n=1 Tax=Calidithermus terrae TaxID=1408545 RepID=A0A399EEF8_9DEIN|nr:hypothetical protein [Calidithermus terrae]RIH83024.1 hypothetical protein Mterra_02430 [Calidithermus terrae]